MKRCGVFALIAAVLLALDAFAEGDSFWVSGSLSAGRLGYYQKPAPINAPVRAK